MTFANIPLAQIHAHPGNPRWHAEADDEMVDSIRSVGILTPITVAPAADGEGYTLIGGHRRKDGAAKAELTQVPAVIREDLLTEAQQLEAMLIENLHRLDLTPVEEAKAYEQLELFGMDVTAIAKATGRKASTVRSRLKLATLPETTRGRLHEGQITLGDAESLLEFSDDPAALATLEEALGTDRFRYELADVRGRRERMARNQADIDHLEKVGAKRLEDEEAAKGWDWTRTTGPTLVAAFRDTALHEAKAHDGCLRWHMRDLASYGSVNVVCVDPSRHDDTVPTDDPAAVDQAKTQAQQRSEWEEQEEARKAARAAQDAASKVRLESLVDLFTAALPQLATAKKRTAASPLTAALRAFMPPTLRDLQQADFFPTGAFLTAAGRAPEREAGVVDYLGEQQALASYADDLHTATPADVNRSLCHLLAALAEQLLTTDLPFIDDRDLAAEVAGLWEWLENAGHSMCDIDVELRNEVTARLAELDSDQDEEADQ